MSIQIGDSTFPTHVLSLNKNGSGVRKSTRFTPGGNAGTNQTGYIYNKYTAGNSGIGGQSIAVRRAKNRKAAFCNPTCSIQRIKQNNHIMLKTNNVNYFM